MAEQNYSWWDGSDLKFLVDIQASGFDMDSDEWSVGVEVGTKIVKTYPKEECIKGDDGNWYVCIDKSYLRNGDLSLIAYASIPDADFDDGSRDEVDKQIMGRIKKV